MVCLFCLLCGQEDCSASPAAIIALYFLHRLPIDEKKVSGSSCAIFTTKKEDCSASPAAIIALRSVCPLGNKVNDKAVLRTVLLPYLWVFVSKLPYPQIQQKPLC